MAPPSRDQAAKLLSSTGCVDPSAPTNPAPSIVPYGIASPLWSDKAQKGRYFALPDGATISVKDCERDDTTCQPSSPLFYADEGDWDFPTGSVLVKNFELAGKLIETRLLIRANASTWWGFSYQWREDQSDADLLEANTDGYFREVATPEGTQTWHYPSRSQCLVCHTEVTGRVLGPETAQLNMDFAYPNGVTGNQLETLIHAGYFAPGAEPKPLTVYPDPADLSQTPEARARSYLHANCATCHRPGAESSSTIDLRFTTPFPDMLLCNVDSEKGDVGVPGALRLIPGEPENSTLSLRMHTLDLEQRMPRIGTLVVDDVGVGAIDDWIRSVTACP